MKTTEKAPPAQAAERVAARVEGVLEAFARRHAVLPLDAEVLEELKGLRTLVAEFRHELAAPLGSDLVRRVERQAEEIAALRARLAGARRELARECQSVAEVAEDRQRVMTGRDQMLADAKLDGERAADERYAKAAAGNAVLEAFVEANRLRDLGRLFQRFARKAV